MIKEKRNEPIGEVSRGRDLVLFEIEVDLER